MGRLLLNFLLHCGRLVTGRGGGVGWLYGSVGWLYNGGVLVQCAVECLLAHQTVDELLERRVGEERCKHKQKEHRFDVDTSPRTVEQRPDLSDRPRHYS